ncbi:response regulator transcription factor [Ideonella sp.]|jgi:DNA-binding response OmpR family regulator|uniref:response regulator transcription factor n=1 Tax=Ideonella sp. TaxID=1929293 RepID=UPI0037BE5379
MVPANRASAEVVIVEDEDILRNELSFVLRHHGFRVAAYASAQELYRHLAVRSAGAVILDIGLVGEDGLSICTYLRRHDPHLGIAFLTARSLRDDRLRGLAAGADAYLVKPVEMQELILILDRLLDRRAISQGQNASATTAATPASPVASAQADAAMGGLPDLGSVGRAATATVAAHAVDTAPDNAWTLHVGLGQLKAPNGLMRKLSNNERTLLYCLAQQQGEVISAEILSAQLQIPQEEYDKHRIEVIISRLRRNIEQTVGLSLPLFAKRGTGYCVRDMVLAD